MIAVGMLCFQMLGWPRDNPLLVRQADLLLRELPDWDRMLATDRASYLHSMYYWYYGTLAMFNMGGRWWEAWNNRLRDLLVAYQHREGDRRGSWDPPAGGFDAIGGRVYTTALNVLNLEIYYRYLPFYSAGAFDAVEILERAARVQGGSRLAALRLLAIFPADRAQAILAAALDDPEPTARAIARQALVAQHSERVIDTLIADLDAESAFTRSQALNALASFGRQRFVPLFIKALRDPEKAVRDRAAIALRKVTGKNLGFRADAEPAEREQAIALWQRWWDGEKGQPPPEGIRGTVLVVDEKTPDAIVLDLGHDQAVRPGYRFEVLRDGHRIAVLHAESVQPSLTVARIVERTAEAIREGDIVRLIPEPGSSHQDN
jgi:hypothetical protein